MSGVGRMKKEGAEVGDLAGVRLIGVPYASGERGVRMGRGPLEIFSDSTDSALSRIQETDPEARLMWVDRDYPDGNDVRLPKFEPMSRIIAQNWEIQRLVDEALADSRIPVLSSGNCATSLGVLGGINRDDIGVVWLDAHADSSTPETSPSGLFDGMPVAIINGRCWKAMREEIPGFHVVPEDRIVSVGMHGLVGGRPGPIGEVVDRAAARRAGNWDEALHLTLERLRTRVKSVYLHVDTDVMDPAHGAVSPYAVPGGLTPDEIVRSIAQVIEMFDVRAINFTAFDPETDPRALTVVRNIVVEAARLITAKMKGSAA